MVRRTRSFIAVLTLALVASACGGSGGSVPIESFSFRDAKPANPEPAGGTLLLAPPEGQEPDGEAAGARGLRRRMGPSREIRLTATDGGPSIRISISRVADEPGQASPGEGMRTVDINGREAVVFETSGLRIISWRGEHLGLSVAGTGEEAPMLEAARAIREQDRDPHTVRLAALPAGYERAEDVKSNGGVVYMSGLAFTGGADEFSMVMIMSIYSDEVDAEGMASLTGQDQPEGYEETTLRGADAVTMSMSYPAGDQEFRSTYVMWRERPDIMIMIMGVGAASDGEQLRSIAADLVQVNSTEWDARFPQDERYFGQFEG